MAAAASNRDTNPDSNGTVSALLSLIAASAHTLEAGYRTHPAFGGCVPSLDDPTPPRTSDVDAAGQCFSPAMTAAVQALEGACAQLCATLARPNHTLLNQFFLTALEPSCLRVALVFKIPDILRDGGPRGMHVTQIGQRCGADPSKLGRALRLLAAKHCFREGRSVSSLSTSLPWLNEGGYETVERDVFANNRLSVRLLESDPMHCLGIHMTGDTTRAAAELADTMADPVCAHSELAVHSAWNRATGQPLPMFDYWAQTPGMQDHGERFGIGMLGWGTTVEAATVVSAYPWLACAPNPTVCDLGGGVGAMSILLARAYPKLRIMLQDLPDRMVQARDVVWPAECPEALEQGRVEFRAVDFLVEPPVPGCDVYYMKNILHAFSTAHCLIILQGIKKVMKPGSRVLIHEYILQTGSTKSSANTTQGNELTRAPEPLLPNYGQGRIRQYYLDVSLMVLLNGKERTLDDYVQLGAQAGLRFSRVWEFGDLSGVELTL
ncbi:unnamed protein product [Mycena citricolor]|uniref:O-methyltransferase C-terminal domain-containing protein n=1 Tax=Mycena citricolor TaxID=2018698 RepID=A0AAD2HCY5_9AGAR|nr:unnamed protein product [Mycena citricolor]